MDEEKIIEAQVIERYKQLAGLLRDGQMVNKDKEERARAYVRERRKFIEQVLEDQKTKDNALYGELIIQANDVQTYLIALILIRSSFPSKEIQDRLEGSTLGSVVGYFEVAARIKEDTELVPKLGKYNKYRNRLAHRMFTSKKLTSAECSQAIALGKEIIDSLIKSVKDSKMETVKSSDTLSAFRLKFNEVAEEVHALKQRVADLEKTNKKKKSR